MSNELLDVRIDGGEPNRTRSAVTRIVIFVVLIVVAGVAITLLRDAAPDPPPEDAAADDVVEEIDDITEDDRPDVEVDETVTVFIESAGRADGVDSLRLPMLATPDDGLVDGQEIRLQATGFTPQASVAIVMCAGTDGAPGGEGSCDVGGYTLAGADEGGAIDLTMSVRRFISTASFGQLDCANPGAFQCVAVVANIADYDESAVANLWFDPSVDGVPGPVIEVSRVDGLADGDTVTVTGSGFPAGGPVVVGQCVVGGTRFGIQGCFSGDAVLAQVDADAGGAFSIDVQVRRVAHGDVDCFANAYGCRIAARADIGAFDLGDGTAANPTRLWFDGTAPLPDIEYGVAYAMSPDRDLADGESIDLVLGNLQTKGDCQTHEFTYDDGTVETWEECSLVPLDDGSLVVQQCVDLAAGEEYCTDAVTVSVVGGQAEISIALQRFFTRDDGSTVDCAEPGRQCELRIGGDVEGYVPLRFGS